jgi:type II secretory pathway pseudopilin PulG
VFRRLITLAVVAALLAVLVPSAFAVRVKVRVEGKTTTIFGAAEPKLISGRNALAALDAASLAGEFYYHVTVTGFGPFVDQIGRYPGQGSSGWSYKVNGVSPPIGADQATIKARDTVLWYWSTFTQQGGSPTLLLKRRAARNCYSVVSQNDLGQATPAAGAKLVVDGREVSTRSGRGCVGRHRGLVRATAEGAVRSNALA